MRRYFLIICFYLTLLCASAFAAGESSGDKAMSRSGLTCFTILPTGAALKPTTCDALCAAKEAVCTGVTSSMNPPLTCESWAEKNWISCRCCTVTR